MTVTSIFRFNLPDFHGGTPYRHGTGSQRRSSWRPAGRIWRSGGLTHRRCTPGWVGRLAGLPAARMPVDTQGGADHQLAANLLVVLPQSIQTRGCTSALFEVRRALTQKESQ